MKYWIQLKTMLYMLVLLAGSNAFAQTPDQVYIPKLGNAINTMTYTTGAGYNGIFYTNLADGSFAVASVEQNLGSVSNPVTVKVFNKSGTQTNSQTFTGAMNAHQHPLRLATLKSGDFVVAYWDNRTCKIQKFTAAGALSGTAVSVYTANYALANMNVFHRIVALNNGGVAILITHAYGGDPLTSGIIVNQYNASLTQVGTSYTSNLSFITTANSSPNPGVRPQLFKLANDNYVVTVGTDLSSYRGFLSQKNLAVLQFDTNNSLVGTIKTFNGSIKTLDGTALANGGYVVMYNSGVPVTLQDRIFYQLYDDTGTAIGTPQTVTDPLPTFVTTTDSYNGQILARTDGGFNLLQYAYGSGSDADMFIRAYTSTGSEITTANKYRFYNGATYSINNNPMGVALPNGGYVYGYTQNNSGTLSAKVVQLDANLNLVGTVTTSDFQSGIGVTTNSGVYKNYEDGTGGETRIYNYGNGFAVPIYGADGSGATRYYGVQRFGATSCLTAPTLSGTTASNACPTTTANLSSLVTSTAPSGSTIKWFNNATASGTAIADPTAVATAGTYYAYYYNATDNCYTPASAGVTVTINSCSCAMTGITPTIIKN